MELHLSDPERELVDEILKERHMIMQIEVEHAGNSEYRRVLKERETMLEDIIERVDSCTATTD